MRQLRGLPSARPASPNSQGQGPWPGSTTRTPWSHRDRHHEPASSPIVCDLERLQVPPHTRASVAHAPRRASEHQW